MVVQDEEFMKLLPREGEDWTLSRDARILDDYLTDCDDPRAGFFYAYAMQQYPREWRGSTICRAALTPRVQVYLAVVRQTYQPRYRADLIEVTLSIARDKSEPEIRQRDKSVDPEPRQPIWRDRAVWPDVHQPLLHDDWYVVMRAQDASRLSRALGPDAARRAYRVAKFLTREVPDKLLEVLFGPRLE